LTVSLRRKTLYFLGWSALSSSNTSSGSEASGEPEDEGVLLSVFLASEVSGSDVTFFRPRFRGVEGDEDAGSLHFADGNH
jgi:hypothetical protein